MTVPEFVAPWRALVREERADRAGARGQLVCAIGNAARINPAARYGSRPATAAFIAFGQPPRRGLGVAASSRLNERSIAWSIASTSDLENPRPSMCRMASKIGFLFRTSLFMFCSLNGGKPEKLSKHAVESYL